MVNIFGGIVRCDRVAQGIVDAYKNMGNINVPIIVRLQGTNADIAKELIDGSGLDVQSAIEFKEAADKVQMVLSNFRINTINPMQSIGVLYLEAYEYCMQSRY